MTGTGRSPGTGPSVCPFVALAEDRDRRADSPDEGNRCYAEPAPRKRDLAYQADYCYAERFASCSVFLAWAARNAAEPAYASEAAREAHDPRRAESADVDEGSIWAVDDAALTAATPAAHPDAIPPDDGVTSTVPEQIDWISASAWAEAPWDERAEQEAEELEALTAQAQAAEASADDQERPEEDLQVPKVPAAVPVRRRKRPQTVIKSRGSGEWFYADPPGQEPLVSRRTGLAPPIMLAVLGLLVAALVVFLIPTLLFGGGDDTRTAAAPSPSVEPTVRPLITTAPVVATAAPTIEPSPSPTPRPETHRVRRGDTLTSIANRYGVKPSHIVCLNNMRNRNVVMLGVTYKIPPEGFRCPPGWRNQN